MSEAAFHRTAPERVIHVIQGDYAVTRETDVILSAILGSCVACCLHDPVAGVGGMNHFLLPGDVSTKDDGLRYGVNSMELLVNGLLQLGARRDRLEAKLFGGANVVAGLSDIGAQNAAFAKKFIQAEGIACVGASLGGTQARRIRFTPSTGAARQILLAQADQSLIANERVRRKPPVAPPDAGALDLF